MYSLLHEQTNIQGRTTQSEDERANYSCNADVAMAITNAKKRSLISLQGGQTFLESIHTEVPNQSEKALSNMLQLGSSVALNVAETGST